jgi:hypothetical protein
MLYSATCVRTDYSSSSTGMIRAITGEGRGVFGEQPDAHRRHRHSPDVAPDLPDGQASLPALTIQSGHDSACAGCSQ